MPVYKVITPVGTSLITNYQEQEKEGDDIKHIVEKLKDRPASEYDCQGHITQGRIARVRGPLSTYIHQRKEDSCAEIGSTLKIKELFADDELDLYLLASDTLLSVVCAELIQQNFNQEQIRVVFNRNEDHIVKDLQVKDSHRFRTGLTNLLVRMEKAIGGNFNYTIINITGGFKATLPFLTIYAQLHKLPCFYLFEESNALLEIPILPLTMNEKLAEDYKTQFRALVEEGIKTSDELGFPFCSECETLLEIHENHVALNEFGKLYWKWFGRPERKKFHFFCTDEIWNSINSNEMIRRAVSTRFTNPQIRNYNSMKKHSGHHVFGKHNDPIRILYFDHEGQIYIYKIFYNDEDGYQRYLDTNPLTEQLRNQIINSCQQKSLEVSHV